MTNTGPILVADDDADEVVLLRLAFMKAGLNNPLLAVADGVVAPLHFRDAAVDLLRLAIEVLFLLLKTPLGVLHLLAALLGLAIEVAPHLQQLFFGLQVRFLDLGFCCFAGVVDDALARLARFVELRLAPSAVNDGP